MAEEHMGKAKTPHRVMTSALFCADGTRAVVLRRGPRLHHRLITWRLADDHFEPGQWMKGTVHLWDLNSAGDKLVYWARQLHASAPWLDARDPSVYRPYGLHDWAHIHVPKREANARGHLPRANEGVWTAVSTPPYFSAFAIWPCLGHWTGGGWFEDDATLVLQEGKAGLKPKTNVRLPDTLKVKAWDWRTQRRPRPLARRPNGGPGEAAVAALLGAGCQRVDWVHQADDGALLFGADGQVFRRAAWRGRPLAGLLAGADRLLDLRDMTFSLVAPPPEALRWPLKRSAKRARRVAR